MVDRVSSTLYILNDIEAQYHRTKSNDEDSSTVRTFVSGLKAKIQRSQYPILGSTSTGDEVFEYVSTQFSEFLPKGKSDVARKFRRAIQVVRGNYHEILKNPSLDSVGVVSIPFSHREILRDLFLNAKGSTDIDNSDHVQEPSQPPIGQEEQDANQSEVEGCMQMHEFGDKPDEIARYLNKRFHNGENVRDEQFVRRLIEVNLAQALQSQESSEFSRSINLPPELQEKIQEILTKINDIVDPTKKRQLDYFKRLLSAIRQILEDQAEHLPKYQLEKIVAFAEQVLSKVEYTANQYKYTGLDSDTIATQLLIFSRDTNISVCQIGERLLDVLRRINSNEEEAHLAQIEKEIMQRQSERARFASEIEALSVNILNLRDGLPENIDSNLSGEQIMEFAEQFSELYSQLSECMISIRDMAIVMSPEVIGQIEEFTKKAQDLKQQLEGIKIQLFPDAPEMSIEECQTSLSELESFTRRLKEASKNQNTIKEKQERIQQLQEEITQLEYSRSIVASNLEIINRQKELVSELLRLADEIKPLT